MDDETGQLRDRINRYRLLLTLNTDERAVAAIREKLAEVERTRRASP